MSLALQGQMAFIRAVPFIKLRVLAEHTYDDLTGDISVSVSLCDCESEVLSPNVQFGRYGV